MSEYRTPVTFGPMRRISVGFGAVVIVLGAVRLMITPFEWFEFGLPVAGVCMIVSAYTGCRGEQQLERDRIARRDREEI